MKAGSANVDITPEKPIPVVGQMRDRLGEYVHDPLTVNAVAFENGSGPVVMVSCDLAYIPAKLAGEIKRLCADAHDVAASSIAIACTHTHLGPNTSLAPLDNIYSKTDPAFVEFLKDMIVRAVGEALADLEDVDLYAGAGYIEQMGFNRRGMRKDGRCDMYYGSWNDAFDGLEGPRDGHVGVIFATTADGTVKVVVPSFSTHPNCVEGESFYSADLVGAVRAFLRRNLNENVGVVYLTGPAGNTAPTQLDNNPERKLPWRGEEGLKRSGMYLGSEIVKTIAGTIEPMIDPVVAMAETTIQIPIRDWDPQFDPTTLPGGHAKYFIASRDAWPQFQKENSPVDIHLNVIRLGDAAICTVPCELYVEFGLKIKARSPAKVTLVAELTDGSEGYVPIPAAIKHGGYSAHSGNVCKLIPEAGGQTVDTIVDLLKRLF